MKLRAESVDPGRAGVENRPRYFSSVRISPDGKWAVASYHDDLVTFSLSGDRAPNLLTRDHGSDICPVWSADGKQIAFSSNRHGHFDIYIMPAGGGIATQVTFHSADDLVCSWHGDGTIIFKSAGRETMVESLYTLDVASGRIELLTPGILTYASGSFSPVDRQMLLYTRGPYTTERKSFRGASDNEIWIKNKVTGESRQLTDNEVNEHEPIWSHSGTSIYYISEASGSFQLWHHDLENGSSQQLTSMSEPVSSLSLSGDGGVLLFVSGFRLYRLNVGQKNEVQEIVLTWELDSAQPPVQRRSFDDSVTDFSLSPNEKRIAVEVFGQIYNLPAGKGKEVRLSSGRGESRNHFPRWQPEGPLVAYLSDAAGNDDLYLVPAIGGESRRLTVTPDNETFFAWSPDGKKIAAIVAMNRLEVYDVESGVSREHARGCSLDHVAWSPDSRWLVYVDYDDPTFTWLVDVERGERHQLTRDNGYYVNPVFSTDGKRLFMAGCDGIAWEECDIYEFPLTREREASDADFLDPGIDAEEPMPPLPKKGILNRLLSAEKAAMDGAAGTTGDSPPAVTIDFFELSQRRKTLIKFPGTETNPAVSPVDSDHIAFFSEVEEADWLDEPSRKLMLFKRHSGSEPEALTPAEPITSFQWSADGSSIVFCSGGTLKKVTIADGETSEIGTSVSFDIETTVMNKQKLLEITRQIAENHADPALRGVDLKPIIERYLPLLTDTTTTRLFKDLVWNVIGELDSSHIYIMGDSTLDSEQSHRQQGFLGLQLEDSDAGVKVNRIIPGGAVHRLNQDLLVEGSIISAVDGVAVTCKRDYYRQMTHRVGKDVGLTFSTDKKERKLSIRADHFGTWWRLMYDDLVRTTRSTVEKLSDGAIGYLHVQEMDVPSFLDFKHHLIGHNLDKQALIIDIRNNPGGYTSQYIIDVLRRIHVGWEHNRNGRRHLTPLEVWQKPLVLLINENSFSDAEILPHAFRVNRLGTIIGTPTAGAVIGISRTHKTVDGLVITVPGNGWYDFAGKELEEMCVPPDILVSPSETDVHHRRDVQIEAAVNELLRQLSEKTETTR